MRKKGSYDLKFITIFFSTVVTLFTFLVLVVILTAKIGDQIEEKQKDNFNVQVKKIKNELLQKDMDSVLEKYTKEGYSIVVFDETDNIVYPKLANTTNLYLNPDGLVSFFDFNGQRVVISYPKSINSKDATFAYFKILPIAITILILVIFIILKIYIKILKKEMSKLKKLISDIKGNTRFKTINKIDYNIRVIEFDEIANELKELHEQNQLKEQELNEEISKVKRLQSNSVSLFNSITHEMKTPLMSSKLIIERIDQNLIGNKNLVLLEELTHELQFLENFTKEILFIAQRKNYSGLSIKNSINEAIRKIEHNYTVLLNEKRLLMDIVVKEDFIMNLDRLLIEKILSNLISNAIYYSELASIIEITITSYSITIKNSINISDESEKVSFSNNKTGLGIFLINMMLLESDYKHTVINEDDEYVVIISKYQNNPLT